MTKKSDSYKLQSVQYLLENNFLEAIKELHKVIEIDPKDSVSWHNRGAFKFNLNRFEEAILDLDKEIEINPNYFVAYENRANAKRKLGDDEGADEENKKADKLKNIL